MPVGLSDRTVICISVISCIWTQHGGTGQTPVVGTDLLSKSVTLTWTLATDGNNICCLR